MGSGIPIAQKRRMLAVPQVKKFFAAIILVVFMLANISGYALAAASAPERASSPKVIMLIVNRVTLTDLTDIKYQNIQRLISMGGVGLMTINTGADFTDMHAYVSIGAGDKLVGSAMAGESYNRDEVLKDGSQAFQVYQRNTGQSSGSSQVLNISIANSVNANKSKYTSSIPGELGNTIQKAGLKTAVIGNSDLAPDDEPNRLAPVIAMDEWGRVDDGNVSREMLVRDPGFPYGWRTDYSKIESELKKLLPRADLIIIESGDTLRANETSKNQLKRMVEYHRTRALEEVDRFIGDILPGINRDTMFMLVTPLPDAQALREGNRLTPLVIAGGKINPGSVLTSPTTRHSGLVANYDIAATAAAHLEIKASSGMVGIPIQSLKTTGSQEFVTNLAKWLTANSIQRVGVLFYFIKYQWLVYTIVFILLITGYLSKFEKTVKFLLTGLLLYPLAILLLPLAGSLNPWVTITESLVLLVLITLIVTRIKSDLMLFIAVAIANIVPAVTDVLTGGYLMNRAALSYDLVVGGRYYGIGNEYMGVVIGAAILGVASLLQLNPKYRKIVLIMCGVIFAGLVFFFAVPTIGSKAGGAITATVGFTVAIYQFLNRKISFKSVVVLLSALLGGVVVLAVFNYIYPVGEQSHIGRAFANLFQGNLGPIWQMILRKVTANYYLLQHSPFSIVLLLQLTIWGTIYYRRRNHLALLYNELPYFSAGITAVFWGAGTAILLNDSGVIGAPLMLNYLLCPLVMQIMRLKSDLGGLKQ